jgi:hypothetical protein
MRLHKLKLGTIVMKIFLVLLLTALDCLAQNEKVTVVATNFITAAPNLRVLNGRLYNTEFDPNWTDVAGEVADISGKGDILVSNMENQTYFILKNYSEFKALSAQISAKALFVGTNNWSEELSGMFPAYDCGQPHRVLIITTNYVSPKIKNPLFKPPHPLPPPVTHPWES